MITTEQIVTLVLVVLAAGFVVLCAIVAGPNTESLDD